MLFLLCSHGIKAGDCISSDHMLYSYSFILPMAHSVPPDSAPLHSWYESLPLYAVSGHDIALSLYRKMIALLFGTTARNGLLPLQQVLYAQHGCHLRLSFNISKINML